MSPRGSNGPGALYAIAALALAVIAAGIWEYILSGVPILATGGTVLLLVDAFAWWLHRRAVKRGV